MTDLFTKAVPPRARNRLNGEAPTADLLRRLDLRRLAGEIGSQEKYDELFTKKSARPRGTTQLEFWPSSDVSG